MKIRGKKIPTKLILFLLPFQFESSAARAQRIADGPTSATGFYVFDVGSEKALIQNRITSGTDVCVLRHAEVSPLRDMIIEYRDKGDRENGDGSSTIWLSELSNPSNRKLLFETGRNANILISHDEKRIAVNDHALSNWAFLFIYERQKLNDYKESETDFGSISWDYFYEKNPRPSKSSKQSDSKNDGNGASVHDGFDHCYSDARIWSGDDNALLIELNGHGGADESVNSWYCIYDFKKKAFTTDLSRLNGKVSLEADK